MTADATICTVLTPMHKRLMGMNYHLIKTLNPDVPLKWTVVDNRVLYMPMRKKELVRKAIRSRLGKTADWPGNQEERVELERLEQAEIDQASDPGEIVDYIPEARVLKGYKPRELNQQFEAVFGEEINGRKDRVLKYLASYLHAAGLDKTLQVSKTRYSIIIDPDFYVIEENWIRKILKLMEDSDLAVFGAPWNPRWYQKFRNFPCTHLMIIDHQKIPYEPNMLAPELVRAGPKYVSYLLKEIARVLNRKTPLEQRLHILKNVILQSWRIPIEDWRQRGTIATSPDTGYRLLERGRIANEFKYANVTPVFDPAIEGFMPNVVFAPQRAPATEFFCPKARRYMPARGTYSRSGFFERGYPNFRALNWEEFLRDGEPFAFHVRGELQRGRTLGIDLGPVWLGLDTIMQKKDLSAPPEFVEPDREDESVAA